MCAKRHIYLVGPKVERVGGTAAKRSRGTSPDVLSAQCATALSYGHFSKIIATLSRENFCDAVSWIKNGCARRENQGTVVKHF